MSKVFTGLCGCPQCVADPSLYQKVKEWITDSHRLGCECNRCVEQTRRLRDYYTEYQETGPQLDARGDPIQEPSHYTQHPSGIECIEITKHMNFCLGNAIKYIWRADLKGDAVEDLKKAIKYLEFEIKRRESQSDQLPGSTPV